MDWKQEVMQQLLPLLVSTAVACASLALMALRRWAQEKAKESALARTLSTLPVLAEVVYKDVYEGTKFLIEEATQDGQLTKEEMEGIRDQVVKELKASISKHGLGALKDAFGPLVDAVLGKIVAAAEAKATQPSP